MKITRFEELDIWKQSLRITKDIYNMTAEEAFSHDFGLKGQLRRAVISVSANIVEGFEKNNNNEFVRYLKIAKGSVGEARNYVYIAHTLKYISQTDFYGLDGALQSLANQVGSLISYLSSHKKPKNHTTRQPTRNPLNPTTG